MPKTVAHTIILVRTSPTSWDAEGRLCGETDLPGTGPGLNALTQSIRDAGIDELRLEMSCILCGPDELSKECAAILRSSPDTKIKKINELREINLGLWEGVLESELEDRFPSAFAKWNESPGKVAPPDGESLDALHARVLTQLPKSLRKMKSSTKCVGLVLRPYAWTAMNCWLHNTPLSSAWSVMEQCPPVQTFSVLTAASPKKERVAPKIA